MTMTIDKITDQGLVLIEFVNPSKEILKQLHTWYNDMEIAHLSRPNFTEKPLEEMTMDRLAEGFAAREGHHTYMISVDGTSVGECSIDFHFPHLFSDVSDTAWIGIIIGDSMYRGKGLGVRLMGLIEEECRSLGARRIELGVFEFNERAKRLYEKMGYSPIARIEDFVFWNGRKWADLRMEKWLT